jgi:hypothetical protein
MRIQWVDRPGQQTGSYPNTTGLPVVRDAEGKALESVLLPAGRLARDASACIDVGVESWPVRAKIVRVQDKCKSEGEQTIPDGEGAVVLYGDLASIHRSGSCDGNSKSGEELHGYEV